MKRLALLLTVLATLAFAAPVSANHEIWKGTLEKPGMHGTVTVTMNWNHTEGRLAYNLDGMTDGDATIFLHGGTCAADEGSGIVLRWVTGRDFPSGDWVGSVPLPDGSAKLFKHNAFYHDGVHVTVRNEGHYECRDLVRTHP